MKKSKRLPKIYYMAPNGIKIDMRRGFGAAYAKECIKTELAKVCQVPKNMLFPGQELVGVTICEPCLNVALTDELNAKGSVEVEFNFGKEGR